MTTLTSAFEHSQADFFAQLERRINEKGDFPALSKSIQNIRQLIQDEGRNIAGIANAILSDFTLTQKIIKLANSGLYSKSESEVTTVSHAVVVLGLDTITNIALNIRTIDTPSAAKSQPGTVSGELEKAVLASNIARNIVAQSYVANGEEAIVCTQLHHLGRLVLVFYFPDEWARIQQIAGGDEARENDAALKVFGMTIDEISHNIAKDWQLPEKISGSVTDLTDNMNPELGSDGWLKTMANFSGKMAALLVNNISTQNLKNFIARYSGSLLLPSEVIWGSIESIQNKTSKPTAVSELEKTHDEWDKSRKRIAVGLLELSIALGRGIDFKSALNIALETIYESMRFNRVIVFFRDAEEFKAGMYFGNMKPEAMTDLYFSKNYTADVFHLSLTQKADVFIQDVTLSRETTIPIWYRKTLPDASAFILLPLVFNNSTIGMIYADWQAGQTRVIRPREFSSLVMLRDYLMKALVKR
ncbi:MAG: HDOD domain-containing protein [Nitrosomonas oligotropha]|uniref:HDOD domain-containing protein n=1 Tax=Nitrosomonas oligotropha TaxID=42354 RepID=A0A5C7VV48_9PROT|nr:MAG: HDOD domain-containing protein [Nitrosomonas oligotropha]